MADDGDLLSYSGAFGQQPDAGNPLSFTLSAPAPAPAAPAPSGNAPAASSLVPNNYADVIRGNESGGQPNAQNPYFPVSRGGPLGDHQFIASTWKSFANANPQLFGHMDSDQVMAARTDPKLSAMAANWYAGVNAPILQAAGIAPTPVNLAIGHALGGAGAAGVLKFPDATPLREALLQSQPKMADAILAQNPSYQTMTVGGLKAKYAGMGDGGPPPAAAPVVAAGAAPPAATPTAGPNALSSLSPFSPEALAKMSPLQRLAMVQQLQSMFSPHHAAAAAGGGGPGAGGVDASIPMSGYRG